VLQVSLPSSPSVFQVLKPSFPSTQTLNRRASWMVVHSAATVSNTVSIPPVPRANTQCTEKCPVPAADSPPPASKSLDSPLDSYHSVYDFQTPPPPCLSSILAQPLLELVPILLGEIYIPTSLRTTQPPGQRSAEVLPSSPSLSQRANSLRKPKKQLLQQRTMGVQLVRRTRND
jgi:hypothetical protein